MSERALAPLSKIYPFPSPITKGRGVGDGFRDKQRMPRGRAWVGKIEAGVVGVEKNKKPALIDWLSFCLIPTLKQVKPSTISTVKLRILLPLHLPPIKQVVYLRSYPQ